MTLKTEQEPSNNTSLNCRKEPKNFKEWDTNKFLFRLLRGRSNKPSLKLTLYLNGCRVFSLDSKGSIPFRVMFYHIL